MHRAAPAGECGDEVVRASNVEQGSYGGYATVEVADEVGADVGEGELGRGQFFGAHFGLETVDADAVGDLFGFIVRVGDVKAGGSHEEGELA